MKNTIKTLITGIVLGLGSLSYAAQTQEELVKHRQQAIQDWQRVLTVLKKAGIAENDQAYKRVHTALKRNEGRLRNLEKGSSRTGQVAKAAAGTGILGTLGGLFGGDKGTTQVVTEKGKPGSVTAASKRVDAAMKKVDRATARKAAARKTRAKKTAPARKTAATQRSLPAKRTSAA